MKTQSVPLSEFHEHLGKSLTNVMKLFRHFSQEISEKNPAFTDAAMMLFAELHKLQSYFSEYQSDFLRYSENGQSNHYELLYRSGLLMNATMEIPQLMTMATDIIIEMCGVGRGFIALVNEKGEYTIVTARNSQKTTIAKPEEQISDTVIRESLKLKDDIQLTANEFNENLMGKSSIIRSGSQALICVPVFADHQVCGIVYLDQFPSEIHAPTVLALVKSFAIQLGCLLKSAREFEMIRISRQNLLNELNHQYEFGNIICKSEAMTLVLKTVARVADKDVAVLIQGETGVGKDLIAKAIHQNSHRRNKPYIAVDCGALPPKLIESELFGYTKGAFTGAQASKTGLLEAANGGTIFLDEINNLPVEVQAKLLRALQQKKIRPIGETHERDVDFRLISAANSDLKTAVNEKIFREDLYYRINTISLTLPPLRDRKNDIFVLAAHFLRKFITLYNSPVKNFSAAFLKALEAHPWYGNVRELEHIIERAVILGEQTTLDVQDLPIDFQSNPLSFPAEDLDLPLEDYVNQCKKYYISKMIKQNGGNRAEAAKQLKLHRTYLYDLIKKLEIQV